MNIESWCTVEQMPKQDWQRAQRSHNESALKSNVLKTDSKALQEDRFSAMTKVQDTKHRERRHFPEKRKYLYYYFKACLGTF